MRVFGKWLGRFLAAVLLVGGIVWIAGPREPVNVAASFDERRFGEGVQVFLESTESVFDDIRAANEKRIVWAQGRERKTRYSVVYLHGFSASAEEIRPVPDQVARALGANLFFARFAGHGRTGEALATARVEDWMQDAAEAMAVGRAIGEEVIVISTSTGGTIAALAALDPEMRKGIRGMVFVSPNFGINNPAAALLTWPAARYWVPLLVGKTRSFEPRNALQAANWTTSYPTVAALPLAAIVKYAVAQDYSGVGIPALFYYSDADKVVVPARTHEVMARWGGPVTQVMAEPAEGVDDLMHVIAGNIISPANTDRSVNMILSWIGGL